MKRDLKRCEDLYKKQANEIGLTYVGESSNSKNSYRRYKLQCGHYKDLLPQNVRKNQVQCKECIQEKYLKVEAKSGLQFICKIDRNSNLYKLPCNHEQKIFKSAVLNSEWICRKCNITYFDLSSTIYLLEIKNKEFSWLKLGYSKNLKIRIKRYKLKQNSHVKNIISVNVKSGKKAISLENKLHSYFFKFRLDPVLMKTYHLSDGYTECYPIELKADILKILKSIRRKEHK